MSISLLAKYLAQVDHQLSRTIVNYVPHTPLFDYVFSFFSFNGAIIIIWIIFSIVLLVYEEIKHRHFIVVFVGGTIFAFLISEYVLKNLYQRLRPEVILPITAQICPIDYSFPSSHAVTAFTASILFWYFDPKRKILYLLFATLVSFSRLYLGCHYVFDVVAGGLIGSLIALIIIKYLIPLLPYKTKKRERRKS